MENVQTIPEAEKISVQVNVDDQRAIKRTVSHKKNGFGMEMAEITTMTNVGQVVQQALIQELKGRGFDLEYGQRPHVLIDVELNELYNDFKVGVLFAKGLSEAKMRVKVQDLDGSLLYAKSIIGKGKESPIVYMNGHYAKIALELALKDAIAQLVGNQEFINALLQSTSDKKTPVAAPESLGV